ncbi:unnamed protein product [Cylindrotheca closterium]|uniref:Uncharacterized protein n=1 Tax=Cylindrotheca closterium TaxID=2856 RepID=A0AAD2CJ53_9STRA|nr:unnamed protein product [Cylindrotheca closterium]
MGTIQLMNSEAQANNKKAGRAAMQFAKAHSLIPDGQCGSRKRHQAIDLALSKQLVWDLLMLQRRAAGWISNDAKSCFDRVVHWVAIVTMLRFGLIWHVGMLRGTGIRPYDSECTLGVMLSPLENHNAQEAQLVSKAKEWAKQLWPHLLHKYNVLPLFRTTILKKHEYPMALTTLNAQQWQDNMSPVLQVCLPNNNN